MRMTMTATTVMIVKIGMIVTILMMTTVLTRAESLMAMTKVQFKNDHSKLVYK
jgi:hypothetical protein